VASRASVSPTVHKLLGLVESDTAAQQSRIPCLCVSLLCRTRGLRFPSLWSVFLTSFPDVLIQRRPPGQSKDPVVSWLPWAILRHLGPSFFLHCELDTVIYDRLPAKQGLGGCFSWERETGKAPLLLTHCPPAEPVPSRKLEFGCSGC
jgi:hypothetical protein